VDTGVATSNQPTRSPDFESEFDEFVAARSDALFRYAFLLTADADDARDLLQEALLKAYLAWGRIREVEQPESYVRRILVTTRTSLWRRRRSRVPEVPFTTDDRVLATEQYGPADDRAAMWQLLQRLPRKQRAVLVLVYYESLTEAEVAALLRCSTGTVKSQKSKALAKLRDWMAQSEGDVHDRR
jgi:RNA polymerase sigma-70 factor (sigma-E family)